MRRRLATSVLVAVVALVGASLAHAQTTTLWPGVTFRQTLQLTVHGPVVMDVLTGPRPGGATSLEPLLSNDTLPGRETLTGLEKRLSGTATYAGVNGDYFNFKSGLPSGGLMAQGQLVSEPYPKRSTAGIMADGTLDVRRETMLGSWQGSGEAHPLNGLNQAPDAEGVALFTSAWGPTTPALPGSVAVVLFPFPGAVPGVDEQAVVQTVLVDNTTAAVPPGGAVIVARGAPAAQLQAEAPVGTTVTLRFMLKPDWPGIVSAIGGGPQLVRDGKPVFRAGEDFLRSQISPRDPRTAVGQLGDGRIVLVTVDGREPGWSVGVTNWELAVALTRLGAVTAMAFDSGGSSTMAFDGRLLNHPSDGRERPISTALAFAYGGVFLPPSVPVVSPNGDGVDEAPGLAYKLVRPSDVTVTLTAPDGSTPVSEALVQQPPGTYPVAFPPPGGAAPAEGAWRLGATAVDDLGQQTTMSRSFVVDDTLGFLETSAPRLLLPPGGRELTISWRLARAARVVVTLETAAGQVVRTLARRSYEAGEQAVVWNGLDRAQHRVKGGVYQARVVARNEVGTVSLTRRFTVRQIAAPRS